MSKRQRTAFRELQSTHRRDVKVRAYGMVPVTARHSGRCPCGREACAFAPGDKIVKFRDAWWNVGCVDRAKLDEVRSTARFVLIEGRAHEKAWTDDPAEAARWTANLTEGERVEDRKNNSENL